MTITEKLKLFETELNYIKNPDIRKFVETAIGYLPEYFFEVPASSSGKFHSALESGFGGLVYHTKAVAKVGNYVTNLEQYNKKLEGDEADYVIAADLLHDGVKHGWENKTGYSVHDHPVLSAEFVREDERLNDIISSEARSIIADAIASHSGQWTTNKRSKVVLPSPQNLIQELVHLSDYIASRSDIHILFDDDEVKPTLPDPNEYLLTWGKHNGEYLGDAFRADRSYFMWAKENVKREPFQSLLKQLEDQEDEI